MSARDAVLARVRDALPRTPEEQTAAEAAVKARLEAHASNLIPARGQLEREERVQLFAQLATAVMSDVRRLATLQDVPAATSTYLREHNLPQKLVLAPEPGECCVRLGPNGTDQDGTDHDDADHDDALAQDR